LIRKAAGTTSVFATLRGIPLPHGWVGNPLEVDDCRAVDAMIRRIGPWLARLNYVGEVSIEIAPGAPTSKVGPYRPMPGAR
jgi:hypothetical protein